MVLSEMISRVRRDLHDEDAAAYRWTDQTLARHIARALNKYSQACPRPDSPLFATTGGSRVVSLAALSDLVGIEAVEYPVDRFPPEMVGFSLWGDNLTLLGQTLPDGSNCRVYCGRLHTLDETSSSLPARHCDLVALGAGGYAAEELSLYTINRINHGGEKTPGYLAEWGRSRLAQFRAGLQKAARRVRVNRLYTPAGPSLSRSTDAGPD